MKVSEVTVEELANFMRLDEPSDIELEEIESMRASAIDYMCKYTGLSVEQLDEHENLVHALHVLVADFFDNRNLYLSTNSAKEPHLNKAVECILNMHSVNLL